MSKLRIETMVLGMVSTNTYILYKEGENQTVIVDPAAAPERILEKCRQLSLTPAAILLTHGHFDHIGVSGRGNCRRKRRRADEGSHPEPLQSVWKQFYSKSHQTGKGWRRDFPAGNGDSGHGDTWSYPWFCLLLYSG